MPDGRTHRSIGTLAGGGCAFAAARDQRPEHLLLEIIGGLAAGNVGARLPDVFDPPIHAHHRSLAHGVVPVAAAASAAIRGLEGWQTQLRAEADRHADLRASATAPVQRLWEALLEILFRLGAGSLAGLIGGYGSHIALDAVTPAGLPLVA